LRQVSAIVAGTRPECERAVARDDRLAGLEKVDSLAGIRAAAERATAELVWILDSGAVPTAETLSALLDAAYEPVASLPVDGSGEPVEAAIGRFRETDVPALLREAGERRVPLRHIQLTSLLAGREMVVAEDPPDPERFGRHAGVEWTARLFRTKAGMLVPASTIRPGDQDRGNPLHALRAARACGWGKGETLRELQRSVTG
jgi:hypothetical protein